MDALVVGGGGREHALAWKLAQSPLVGNVFITPGNAGTALVGENVEAATSGEILSWLKKHPVGLVIIGSDNYLAEGLTDKIRALNIPAFGPTKAAAEIEWSKSFAKQLMHEEGIPTAASETFTDYESARAYMLRQVFPLVIKADGLALGKGVVIATNPEEAEEALSQMMKEEAFGDAGKEVVIEEYLEGREISIHAFCDGEHAVLFPASKDHKRVFDGDAGPNTGGMGTIVPVPWVTNELLAEVKEKIVLPCLRGLKERGRTFVGVLYPGIMVTESGPKVIEFNARFGDPEAQSYMRILQTDLAEVCLACVNGRLDAIEVAWEEAAACCVTVASGGYPGSYEKGALISGLESGRESPIEIFHAGTKRTKGGVVTNGGRVLGVTATAKTLPEALSTAYKEIGRISFDGMQFRKDIGLKI